ncbi:nitroreductase [Mycena capillaripes]|nr:nitroreductase [Mycena capillaripes]
MSHESQAESKTNGAVPEAAEGALATQVDRLLKERFSARYYLPDPVDKRTIEEIVDAAHSAASSYNLQPWKVFAIAGQVKDSLSVDMVHAHTNGIEHVARYAYDPETLPELYAARRFEFGKFFYEYQGIAREDVEARAAVDRRNYTFFDAPMALIFTINSKLMQGAWMDLGAFIQGITIGARARGLESVLQIAIPRYDALIRKHLPVPEDELVAVAMSLGYPDIEKIKTKYVRPPKQALGDVLEVHGL